MKNFVISTVAILMAVAFCGCPMTSIDTDVEFPTLTFKQGKEANEAVLTVVFPREFSPESYLLPENISKNIGVYFDKSKLPAYVFSLNEGNKSLMNTGEIRSIGFDNFNVEEEVYPVARVGRKMIMTVKFDESGRINGGLFGIDKYGDPQWFDLTYFVGKYGANNSIINAQGEIDFHRSSYLTRPNGEPIEDEEGEVVEPLEGETVITEGETVEPLEGETVITEGETVEPVEGETLVTEGETVDPLEGETEVVEGEVVETGPFTLFLDRFAVKVSADLVQASSFEMLIQGIPFEQYVEGYSYLNGLTSVSLQDNGDIYLGFANVDVVTLDGIIVSVIRNSDEPIEVSGYVEVYDDPWLPSTIYPL